MSTSVIMNHSSVGTGLTPASTAMIIVPPKSFQDVTECHSFQCSSYPVACPNACQGSVFKRHELDAHLRDQCPLTLVDCPFSYAGCVTQLPRKDMPEHMTESAPHLALMATAMQQLQQSAKDKDEKYKELLHNQLAAEKCFEGEAHALREEVQVLKEEVCKLKTQYSSFPLCQRK